MCLYEKQNMSCQSSAAGLRRLEVTAAALTSDAARARAEGGGLGLGRVLGGDIETAKVVERKAETTEQSASAAKPDTRTRDACILASVAVGIVTMVGVIIAIDPFN